MGLRVKISILRNKEIVDLAVSQLMERYKMRWRLNYVPILNAMLEELSRVEINNVWYHGDYSRNFAEDCSAYDVVLGTLQMKMMNLTGCTPDESHHICTMVYTLLQDFALDMDEQINLYIRNNHIDSDTMVFNFMVEDLADGLIGAEYYLVEKPIGIHDILTEDNDWLVPVNSYRAGNLALNASGTSSSRVW